MSNFKKFSIMITVFLACYFMPVENIDFQRAVMGTLLMLQDYAQKHVLLCLIPAFFIAGAIATFISQAAVMKYLGAEAKKIIAYSVASVSGSILAVCSCSVLPLFAGIYKMGAGLGPATAFLYSGPGINVLAIVLTAKILGWKLGVARAILAIAFAFIIGLLMAVTFRNEEKERAAAQMYLGDSDVKRTLLQESLYFLSMVGILVFANWAKPSVNNGVWALIYSYKWQLASLSAFLLSIMVMIWYEFRKDLMCTVIALTAAAAYIKPEYPLIPFLVGAVGIMVAAYYSGDEPKSWLFSSRDFSFQILPLLFAGVIAAGFLLGMPGKDTGIIPAEWIAQYVGGNSLFSNFFAALSGAFMYFATLTEVPILQGLIGAGMGKGPALALLLAGPALSLPNMIVIRSVLGTKKTVVFVSYVVILSTIAGKIYGFYSS